MSTIRYNTKSNLIQRIQRNEHLNKQDKRLDGSNEGLSSTGVDISNNTHNSNAYGQNNSVYTQNDFPNLSKTQLKGDMTDNDDPPFQSKYGKNTNEYLLDLCISIYPSTLHDNFQKISQLNNGSLECHAFLALIVKNFVNYWYGPKIPSEDPELLEEIFKIFDNFIIFVQDNTGKINVTSLLLDDIPLLIADHIKIVRSLKNHGIDHFSYKDYIKLSLIDQDTYPFVITDLIKYHLPCSSLLQNTFLDSLLNQFLLGRILDGCSEPYYALRAIIKVSDKIIERKEIRISTKKLNSNVLQKLRSKIQSFSQNIMSLIFNSKLSVTKDHISDKTNVLNSYIWTLINIDILSLHKRRPLLYTLCCYIQKALTSSKVLNNWINDMFLRSIYTKALSSKSTKHTLNSIRTLLFPNDDLMGPRTVIPIGEEYNKFKFECSEKLWKVIQLKKLDSILGITEEDIVSCIDMICLHDKRCNKILILRILDCITAHLIQET